MKYLIERSLYKLFLACTFIVVTGVIICSMETRVEAFRRVAQEDAGTAIANTCAALLDSCARNPVLCGFGASTNTVLVDYYNEFVKDIMSLNLNPASTDLALAEGIIKAALIEAVARNPSLQSDLETIAANCNNDIESILSH